MSTKYTEAWEDSDIVFVVEEQLFHCHYAVLKFNSPVFSAMFNGNFREEMNKPVPLPGKEKDAFAVFLDLLYPIMERYPPVKYETLLKVLQYSGEYQTKSVQKHVDHMLYFTLYSRPVSPCVSLIKLFGDLRLCEQYNLEETRQSICRHIAGRTDVQTFQGTEFMELSGQSKFEIIAGLIKSCNQYMDAQTTYNPLQLLKSCGKYAV